MSLTKTLATAEKRPSKSTRDHVEAFVGSIWRRDDEKVLSARASNFPTPSTTPFTKNQHRKRKRRLSTPHSGPALLFSIFLLRKEETLYQAERGRERKKEREREREKEKLNKPPTLPSSFVLLIVHLDVSFSKETRTRFITPKDGEGERKREEGKILKTRERENEKETTSIKKMFFLHGFLFSSY